MCACIYEYQHVASPLKDFGHRCGDPPRTQTHSQYTKYIHIYIHANVCVYI